MCMLLILKLGKISSSNPDLLEASQDMRHCVESGEREGERDLETALEE